MNPTISLNPLIKQKLKEYKEENGCNSYSDAINLLLQKELLRKKLNKNDATN